MSGQIYTIFYNHPYYGAGAYTATYASAKAAGDSSLNILSEDMAEDETAANNHIQSWCENNQPEDYKVVAVKCGEFASVADLISAGLASQLGELSTNSLVNVQVQGNA